jgi:hypothetical protein
MPCTSMLLFLVYTKLQPRLDPQPALPRLRFLARSIPSVLDRLPQHSHLQLSNVSTCFIQALCSQSLTHSFAQRATNICFPFNHFRTLSIAMGGVPPVVASRISSRAALPLHAKSTTGQWFSHPSPPVTKHDSPVTSHPYFFHTLTNCKFSISFLLTIMQIAGGVGGPAAASLKYYFNSHFGTPYQPAPHFAEATRGESGQSAALTLDCPIDFSEEVEACGQ